jgi:hypothetical protein
VAFNAAYIVIGWSKTIRDSFAFGEYELVIFKPAIAASGGWLSVGYAFIDRCAPRTKTIKKVIGFGVHVGGECFGGRLTFDSLRGAQGYDERHRKQD